MEQHIKETIRSSVRNFRLPRYEELPDMGLYLDQVAKYIAEHLSPLQNISLTPSMISNYVKKGLIANPVKKLYGRDQLAYLFFIATTKTVATLEDIQILIPLQQRTYDTKTAYNYFCREFENILFFIFGLKDDLETVGVEDSDEKTLLRNVIITVAHKVYLDKSLRAIEQSGIL